MQYGQERIRNLHWQQALERFESTETISKEFLSQVENTFLNTDTFSPDKFAPFELREIFSYLKESHSYYLDICLPKIENTLHQLYAKFADQYISLGVLLLFIEKYKAELVKHILYEEQVLFRFVEKLLSGTYSSQNKDFVINHFLHTHNDNVILYLDELRQDLVRFDNDLKENLVFKVLFNQLESFQHDLLIHGLIEDNVFIDKILMYINENYEQLPLGVKH